MEYFPKIDTLYKRDKTTFNVIEGDYTRPEFAEHDNWLINEKLDGSNISIVGHYSDNGVFWTDWRGRTERAQFHKEAVAHLNGLCESWHDTLKQIVDDNDLKSIEFFGELIGPKIQKGGIYATEIKTKFYDIRVGDLWLPWDAVLGYAHTLNYEVPYFAYGATTDFIVNSVREGFNTLEHGGSGGPAEGLICKTNVPLYNNNKKRLIFKLKTVDFSH